MCTYNACLAISVHIIHSYAQRDSPTYEPYESNERLVCVMVVLW